MGLKRKKRADFVHRTEVRKKRVLKKTEREPAGQDKNTASQFELSCRPLREYSQLTKGQSASQPINKQVCEKDRLKRHVSFVDYTTVREYAKIPPSCSTKYWHQPADCHANNQLVNCERRNSGVGTDKVSMCTTIGSPFSSKR